MVNLRKRNDKTYGKSANDNKKRRTLRKRKDKTDGKSASIFDGTFYWLIVIFFCGIAFVRWQKATATDVVGEQQNRLGNPEKEIAVAEPVVAVEPVTAALAVAEPVVAAPTVGAAAKCVQDSVAKANPTKEKQKNRQQILYIHPGTPRTTKTLQNLMKEHISKLNEDGIFVVGIDLDYGNCEIGYPRSTCFENINCKNQMKETLDEYYKQGVDVIITNEFFWLLGGGSDMLTFFNDFVKRNMWEIRVLIGYMPFFDFTRAGYYQSNSNSRRSKLQIWPRDGGFGIRSITGTGRLGEGYPDAESLSKIFQPHADQISIYDVSKPITGSTRNRNYKEEFFCFFLSGACEAQKALSTVSGQVDEVRQDDILLAGKLEYDRIATAASVKGYAFSTLSRHEASGVIREHVENVLNISYKDLPLICYEVLSELENLKLLSLEQEKRLFPERDPNWETPQLFDLMLTDKMFCNVDTEKVLNDPKWQEILKTL